MSDPKISEEGPGPHLRDGGVIIVDDPEVRLMHY